MDTIIAQATPAGESALGVIRISGNNALSLAKHFCNKKEFVPRTASLQSYINSKNETIDQVLVTYFECGKSYTGEQSIEISFHGNPLIAELICNDLLTRGCRLAEPGEFTKRAFLNGKIDLSQAESVAQIISATNESSLFLAQKNLKGELSEKLLSLQESILSLQSSIEAHIDFPEEDTGNQEEKIYLLKGQEISTELECLLEQARRSKLLTNKTRVVIVGQPNVGKSTLFNTIIGKERALTHSHAGTTRDYLEYDIKLDGRWITLVDTAGVRDTKSDVEIAGIELAKNQANQADIILWVIDNSTTPPTLLPEKLLEFIENKPTILIRNKTDLGENNWAPNLNKNLSECRMSLKENCDIANLENLLAKEIISLIGPSLENEYLIGTRHESLISECKKEMESFLNGMKKNIGFELTSQYLTSARKNLDEMIGSKTNDHMLDLLFKQFCIGK